MEKKKKPELVVWSEEKGYDAKLKPYPTNIGAPKFDLPNVSLVKTNATKKMIDVFEREKQEIINKIENLYEEFNQSVMVWESKISFEPIVGQTYYLYEFDSGKTLSIINPNEWNKKEQFIGAFTLTSENKWIRNNNI